MIPWTARVLCAFAQIQMPHRPELRTLDETRPISDVLARINALVPDEPKVMMLNARVETDQGLLRERLVEGREPADDDGYHPAYRLLYGRLGDTISMLPYFPPEEGAEYRDRIDAIMAAMADGAHPNIRREVAVPTQGTRTYATITFYRESDGPGAFARFSWRKDLRETDAAWLIKDAWTRLCRRNAAARLPSRRGPPS